VAEEKETLGTGWLESRKGKGMDYYKSRYISYISISFPRLQLFYMVLKSKVPPHVVAWSMHFIA
jgi:hypothetical protein